MPNDLRNSFTKNTATPIVYHGVAVFLNLYLQLRTKFFHFHEGSHLFQRTITIMRKTNNMSFQKLVQENKKQLLNNKQELERIEKRIEQRHEIMI